MPQRHILALHARQLVLQGGDEGPRRGEIVQVGGGSVSHARI